MKFPIFILSLLICQATFSQKMEALGAALNSEYAEINPIVSADGKTIYFVRVEHPSNTFGKGQVNGGSQDVWYTEVMQDGRLSLARKMPNQINKSKYNNLLYLSPDENTAIINGVFDNGVFREEIGLSLVKKKGNQWQQPDDMHIPDLDKFIKEPGQYLTAFLSSNGKDLLLSFSEKRKSFSCDIYISHLDKKNGWSRPEPLSDKINTDASETTPFLTADNSILYFASDRKGGEGGYDIWMSKRQGRSWNSWAPPVNMGKIINSDNDDMYYVLSNDGETAYMATKKNAVGKYDIMRIKLNVANQLPKEGALASSASNNQNNAAPEENTKPTNVVLLSGIVRDIKTGKPAEAKIIYENLETGEEIGQATSNPSTGEYKLILPYGYRYSIRAESKDFMPISKNIDLTIDGKYKEIKNEDLGVAPIQQGVTVLMNNIFFEFGKAVLQPESFLELDRMVGSFKENPNLIIEIQGHTDDVGSDEANLKLSQARADAVRDYFLSKKVAPERVKSVGFGEKNPVASNATSEGQAKNRRVEFLILRK